jgi:hypothetical protein
LWIETELRKHIPKDLEAQYVVYKERLINMAETNKQLKKTFNASSLEEVNNIKKLKAELKEQFVGMVARYIIKERYNIHIAVPKYRENLFNEEKKDLRLI